MRISFASIFMAMVAVVATILFCAPAPAEAAYTGACVKKTLADDSNKVQYYVRIPNGKAFADYYEDFPGQVYYDNLKHCHIKKFSCVYDANGNAHVDFVFKVRRNHHHHDNRCDIAKHIARATDNTYTPRCVEGGPEVLASEWRKSWKPE